MTRTLVARLDNVGDVLLTGPAVRAVAAAGEPVTFLAGPTGARAAELLPGVAEVLVYDAPWVPFDARPLDRAAFDLLIAQVSVRRFESAVILTSFHQSALPLAMMLRLAGVRHIAATSVDYPGSLLDVRVGYDDTLHEVEQSLAVCTAAGFALPAGDRGELRLAAGAIRRPRHVIGEPYVVVHPGASVPARELPVAATTDAVCDLTAGGWHVVVTGSPSELDLAHDIARRADPDRVHVLAGQTSLREFAGLLAGAAAVVCGNTGAAHLAAAVGTPVVEAFAPVVAPERWRPWGVPHELFGAADIGCAGCRSRTCPLPEQPCLAAFTPAAVVAAVERLTRAEADATGRADGTGWDEVVVA